MSVQLPNTRTCFSGSLTLSQFHLQIVQVNRLTDTIGIAVIDIEPALKPDYPITVRRNDGRPGLVATL